MSQYADLTQVFRDAKRDNKISEEHCIEIFIGVMGAVEWDLPDVDYEGEDWIAQEKMSARQALFGANPLFQ